MLSTKDTLTHFCQNNQLLFFGGFHNCTSFSVKKRNCAAIQSYLEAADIMCEKPRKEERGERKKEKERETVDKQKDECMKGCESKLAGDHDGIHSGFNANTENPIMALTAQELGALIS